VTFENPALLPGGLPFDTKVLMEAFLWYSSSISRLRLCRRYRKAPPAMAAIRTTPTTTPATIPAVLDFDDFLAAADSAAAETDAA